MNAIAPLQPTSLLERMALRYGVEPNKMMATLKATAFKGEVSNEQMMALLIVAEQHGLNPWLKEIYAFPDRSGIVPVVGIDGWSRIINEHPQFDGIEFEQDDESCTCTIYRKDRSHPISTTEYLSECKRDTSPWKSHPRRMLRHKAMIQCARIAFAFAGIHDPDEAERIIDVTPPKAPSDLNAELGLDKPFVRTPDAELLVAEAAKE
jgi:phage recombination protein Bet